mmetsp:Transcript_3939/g.10933  ORF Transcript_3939/g.10933 Transcript_3939/m.10933 type:complete len:189 (-) Transcript_3939:125-691(-)
MPFPVYKNEIPIDGFLADHPPLNFVNPLVLEVKPKHLGGSGLGWQAGKPNQTLMVVVGETTLKARALVSCIVNLRYPSLHSFEKEWFLANAGNLDVSEMPKMATPLQFHSGSIGWKADDESEIVLDGQAVQVLRHFLVVLNDTKPHVEGEECRKRAAEDGEPTDDKSDDEPLVKKSKTEALPVSSTSE